MHNIPSEEKAGYISLTVLTDTTISENIFVDSSTTDLCEQKPKD